MSRPRVAVAVLLCGVSLAASGHADAKQHQDKGASAESGRAAALPGPPAHVAEPPGQAKKQAAAQPQTAGRAAGETAQAQPAAEQKARGAGAGVKPKPQRAAAKDETPAEAAPAAAAAAAPAPAVAAATTAPAPAAAPVPAATPAARPRRQRPARRSAGRERRVAPAARTVTAPPSSVTTTTAAVVERPEPRARRQPAKKAAEPRTLTKLVTRVVEVIPRPVRLALTGLAVLAGLLLLGLLAAGFRGRRLARQRRRLMADVGLLQSALLPELDARVGPATVSAAYRPAEGLAAGGDFYDAFMLDDDQTCVILGDVGGHGRDAIPVTALVRYTVRAYLEGGLSPRQALQIAGRVLQPQLRETLVTVLVAVYDAQTGLLTVATAGHPPPVVSTDPVPAVVAFSSPAFGLGPPTGRRQITVPLPPGSTACFYTDGLADVIVDGERLGLAGLAAEIRTLTAGEGARELVERLVERSDAQPDDMAAFVLRPPSEAPAPRVGRIEELEVDARDVERGRLGRYLAEYGVTDGVADAATKAVLKALQRAHAVVIEINHDASGATVSVMDSPDVVALPLAPAESADEVRAVASS